MEWPEKTTNLPQNIFVTHPGNYAVATEQAVKVQCILQPGKGIRNTSLEIPMSSCTGVEHSFRVFFNPYAAGG